MKRSAFKSKLPPRRPERQWEGPAPVLERPRAVVVASRPASGSVVALAFALPALDAGEREATGKTAAGRAHMGRVAALGCVLCRLRGIGSTPAEVHHIRMGQGMAQRAPDFLTIPLCPTCHRGPFGVHGDKRLLRQAKVSELDLLAETIALLFPATQRAGFQALGQP